MTGRWVIRGYDRDGDKLVREIPLWDIKLPSHFLAHFCGTPTPNQGGSTPCPALSFPDEDVDYFLDYDREVQWEGTLLADDQVDRLADLVAEKLSRRAAGELISPRELAARLKVSREFVYDHAEMLGCVRLGSGPRPRLAFRWPHVLDHLTPVESPKPVAKSSRRSRKPAASKVELLPIRGNQR